MRRWEPILRWGLAVVFLYAGMVKAPPGAQFAVTLVPFTFLPSGWILPIAWGLPWVEIAAGLLILPRQTRLIGAGMMVALCAVFCVVLAWALTNGIIVACSCFGRDESPSAWKMLAAIGRDIVLIGVAGAVFVAARRKG